MTIFTRKKTRAIATAIALSAALTACAAPQRGPSNTVIERALRGAPGAAQPSTIVAVEIAHSRAAREQGQFAAGRQFAAPGALFHGANGPVSYTEFGGTLDNPETATQWSPRVVVLSCDGTLALTQGRFIDAEGLVGTYVTTWARRNNGDYRWTYDVSGRDNPQPPPRVRQEEGDIVVRGIDLIEGLVATCPRGGGAVPPPPAIPIAEEGAGDAQLSSDGTLRWRWEQRDDGTRFVSAQYFYQGQWLTAIEQSLAFSP